MAGRALKLFWIVLICSAIAGAGTASTSPITVRYQEGIVHGFLVLSTPGGEPLAYGELAQVALRGDRVSAHVVLRFKDGSMQDETTVFSQRGTFRLISYRLEQKGPAFKIPLEMSIDNFSHHVTVHYTEDGKEKDAHEQMPLPTDLANGLLFTLLKNMESGKFPMTASMVVATPKPRLVKLVVTRAGEDPFLLGASKIGATHYVIKVELGGVAGAVAPLVGKQPPDLHVWIRGGEAPVFVKSEGPLYADGPVWRMELASPVWPDANVAK
jgi:hypothetical protein